MTTGQKPQTTPAPTKAPAPTATTAATAPAKVGKRKATEAELAAREAARKAESPAARFVRVTRPRIQKAVNAMRQLETIGRGAGYEYTAEQAGKVLQHLTDGVTRVKVSFSPKVRGARAVQELPDL